MKKECNEKPTWFKRPKPPPAPHGKDQFGFSIHEEMKSSCISHPMTNEELQDCIINTNAMLKACEGKGIRHDALLKHFERLLELQIHRASLVKINYK